MASPPPGSHLSPAFSHAYVLIPCPALPCTQVHRMKEEGIVIKALDSPWKSNERRTSWLK